MHKLVENNWGQEEHDAIQAVIISGQFTMGPMVHKFEEEFASFLGRRHAIMVNSGSSANLLASLFYRRYKPLRRGDEAIVPAVAWSTTYSPLHQYGLKLRVVDVDIDTLNIDVRQLERALTPETRLIVAVNILGNPAALDTVQDFAKEKGLYFLEDNCESMGAKLNGKQAGTFGDIGTFSMFFSHQLSTAEGGFVTTDDDECAALVKCLRAHGWDRDLSPVENCYFPVRESNMMPDDYHFLLPGYNVRPLEISAAVGLVQFKKLREMISWRRWNMMYFQNVFKRDDRFITQRENGTSSSFCFPIVLNPKYYPISDTVSYRAHVLNALAEEGIEARMITGGNLLNHPVVHYYDYAIPQRVFSADLVHNAGFFVGNHPRPLVNAIHHLYMVLDRVCRHG